MGLYVVGILLLCVLAFHYFYSVEGFATKVPAVPSFCGTYGYTTKDIDPKKIPKERAYTASDCEALKGVLRYGTQCVKLKSIKQDDDGNFDLSEENIKINYSKKCGGLNHQNTTRPSECGSVGKPNVEFSITLQEKKLKIPANSFMVYTEDECINTLNGTFQNLQTFKDQTKKSEKELAADFGFNLNEVKLAIKKNGGDDIGFCSSADSNISPNFSMACTGPAGLMGGGGGFFEWIKSFF